MATMIFVRELYGEGYKKEKRLMVNADHITICNRDDGSDMTFMALLDNREFYIKERLDDIYYMASPTQTGE